MSNEKVSTVNYSYQIKKIILEQSKRANVGHIGSALSIADIMEAIYFHSIRIENSEDPDRDRFILSKGHAALALYAALYLKGVITEKDINQYCADNTQLGVHPEHALRGIDFSTGSLGQGLSFGAGSALSAIMQGSDRRVFVLMSDAECNEGSVWEAVMFSAHHNLANLIVVIDLNGQQALGYTDSILNLSPMAARWRAFDWDVHEVDGHNVTEISEVIQALDTRKGQPHVLLANTICGKGVSFMEKQIKWHYWPMSDTEYKQALTEIGTVK